MRFLRQNTAVIITVGPFYDKTDGVTIETALTITNERITLTADTDDNSAPTNILDNVTGATSGTSNDLNYITGNDAGMMQLELSAANTNRVGRMFLSITDAANHVPVFHEFFVLPQAIYDWLTGVIVPLPANVTTWLGTAAATPTVAGVPEVDVTHLVGVAQSATDLKDFADDGYDPSTNKVQGVVLTDTVTTYTGNTPQTGDSFARIGVAGAGLTNIDLPNQTMDITGNITGNLSGSVGSVSGAVGSVTAGVTLAASAIQAIWDALTAALTTAGSIGKLLVDNINATISSRASQASVDTVDDFLDTEIAAIKAKTDPMTYTVANQLDSNIKGISDDSTAADRLEALMDGILIAQINDAGATTTVFIADGFTEATNDHFNGRLITFISGALSGQQTAITDYVGATQTFTVNALTEAPANNDFFVIH